MYYVLCGFPSAKSDLMRRLCFDIIQIVNKKCEMVYANQPLDLRDALTQGKTSALLFFDFPDKLIARQLVRGGLPTICVQDSFRDVVTYSMVAWNMDLPSAIRHAALSANCLQPIFAAEQGSLIDIGFDTMTLASCVNQIAMSFGLTLKSKALKTLAEAYGVADPNSREMFADMFLQQVEHAREAASVALTPEEAELLAEVSESYEAIVTGDGPLQLFWPSGLFSEGVPPFRPATSVIDLTGPARILFYGPYIPLMEGSWEADIRFLVSGNLSGNILRIEVAAAGEVVASSVIILPHEGAFSTRVGFDVARTDVPYELRGILNEGAIEGEFHFAGIMLTHMGVAEPENP